MRKLFRLHGRTDLYISSDARCAVRMVKDGIKGVRQGVYLVRVAGSAGIKQKVVAYEK